MTVSTAVVPITSEGRGLQNGQIPATSHVANDRNTSTNMASTDDRVT
jgi:hypothetical protein